MTTPKRLSPVHLGEILLEEFLKPVGISQYRLAQAIKVPPRRINQIVKAQRAVTADTALRLGLFFRMSPEFWMNLQACHDLELQRDQHGARLEREVEALEQPTA